MHCSSYPEFQTETWRLDWQEQMPHAALSEILNYSDFFKFKSVCCHLKFSKKNPKNRPYWSRKEPLRRSLYLAPFFYPPCQTCKRFCHVVLFPSHISDLGEEMTCPLCRYWTVFDVLYNSLWLPASPLCVSVPGYCIWTLRIPAVIEILQCGGGGGGKKTKTYLVFCGARLKISGKMEKKKKSYASIIHVRMLTGDMCRMFQSFWDSIGGVKNVSMCVF